MVSCVRPIVSSAATEVGLLRERISSLATSNGRSPCFLRSHDEKFGCPDSQNLSRSFELQSPGCAPGEWLSGIGYCWKAVISAEQQPDVGELPLGSLRGRPSHRILGVRFWEIE
jgi:hypothetical protein